MLHSSSVVSWTPAAKSRNIYRGPVKCRLPNLVPFDEGEPRTTAIGLPLRGCLPALRRPVPYRHVSLYQVRTPHVQVLKAHLKSQGAVRPWLSTAFGPLLQNSKNCTMRVCLANQLLLTDRWLQCAVMDASLHYFALQVSLPDVDFPMHRRSSSFSSMAEWLRSCPHADNSALWCTAHTLLGGNA